VETGSNVRKKLLSVADRQQVDEPDVRMWLSGVPCDLECDSGFADSAAAGDRQQAVLEEQRRDILDFGTFDKGRQRRWEAGLCLPGASSRARSSLFQLRALDVRKSERLAEGRYGVTIGRPPGSLLERCDGAGTYPTPLSQGFLGIAGSTSVLSQQFGKPGFGRRDHGHPLSLACRSTLFAQTVSPGASLCLGDSLSFWRFRAASWTIVPLLVL
jgi:hypothetical protein